MGDRGISRIKELLDKQIEMEFQFLEENRDSRERNELIGEINQLQNKIQRLESNCNQNLS